MKVLESGSIDEYYQTINTWIKIVDEKNKTVRDNANEGEQEQPKKGTRKKFQPKIE